jgi:hypothetical protein
VCNGTLMFIRAHVDACARKARVAAQILFVREISDTASREV